MKLYISPSDQTENLYAWGSTNEAVQCERIAESLETALRRVSGIQVRRNTTGAISSAIRESNEWGADYHICIHTNAFDGTVAGTRLFCWDEDGDGFRACQAVMEALAPITPGTSDGIRPRPELNEIRGTAAVTVYIEIGFHDNPAEAQWIVGHTEQIAQAICQGMCRHLGLPVPEDPWYRVQVGAFRVYENARALQQKLIAQGYPDAFIRKE